MKENGDTIHCIELYDVFPRTISGVWQPFVTIAPLGNPLDGQIVLHEEQVSTQISHFVVFVMGTAQLDYIRLHHFFNTKKKKQLEALKIESRNESLINTHSPDI